MTKQTRLTNYTREAIAEAALKAAFEPKKQALLTAEDALAREAYAAVFTPDEVKKAKALPANWLRRDPCLHFNVNGLRIELCTIEQHLPVPYQSKSGERGYGCHRQQGSISAGDLADRITAHAMAKEKLRDEKRDASNKLSAMLSSISTMNKLKETWPEGEQFYAQFMQVAAPLPPAIRVDEINSALGLY